MKSLHATTFAVYLAALYYDTWHVVVPPDSFVGKRHNAMGGKCKYLTHLNLLLQCVYFGLALLNDVCGSSDRHKEGQTRLQKARDWLFTSLVFPLGAFVTFLFWSIYAFDRELILPSSMDAWFPCWLNHVMHTLPLAAGVLEQVLVYHRHRRGITRLLPMVLVYLLYLCWLVLIRYKAGFWVYPVFDALDDKGRAVFFILLSVPALFFYVIGEKIHVAVWGLNAPATAGKKKRAKRD